MVINEERRSFLRTAITKEHYKKGVYSNQFNGTTAVENCAA